jgi:hypothetical protein
MDYFIWRLAFSPLACSQSIRLKRFGKASQKAGSMAIRLWKAFVLLDYMALLGGNGWATSPNSQMYFL